MHILLIQMYKTNIFYLLLRTNTWRKALGLPLVYVREYPVLLYICFNLKCTRISVPRHLLFIIDKTPTPNKITTHRCTELFSICKNNKCDYIRHFTLNQNLKKNVNVQYCSILVQRYFVEWLLMFNYLL